MTSWWRHHGISTSLILDESSMFTLNLIISHPILIRLNRTDHTLIDTNPWHRDDVTVIFPLHWFLIKIVCLHLDTISHSILRILNDIDHTLIEMSHRRDDDVITTFPVHWFWSKIVCLQLYNSIISHPILMILHRIDHTLIEINSNRYDDVISSPPFRFTDFGRKKHGLACESQFHRPA